MCRVLKIILLLCILMTLALLLCSCMDAQDINEKFIVTTVAVDKVGDEFWFFIEAANIQGGSAGASGSGTPPMGSKYFFVKGHGKTFTEARLDVDRQLDQPIYLGGVRTLLLTERFASDDDDMVQYLYRVRADETYRKKVMTVITRDDLEEMFTAMNEKNLSVGYSTEYTITSLEQQGETFTRTTARLIENISSRYCGILIPCIGLRNKEIYLAGYSVIDGTDVIGFIPLEDSAGVNMLKTKEARVYFNVPYEDKVFAIKTVVGSLDITPYYQNNDISFLFSLSLKATVEYGNKRIPYNLDQSALKEMENTLKQMILEKLLMTVDQSQNLFHTDYLQMDDAFRIKYPQVFERLDWQTAFQDAQVFFDIQLDVSVSTSLDYEANPVR